MDGAPVLAETSGHPAGRAVRHAALGDPVRLAAVDELVASDRSPSELAAALGLSSNLLAHHLAVLERAGLVRRDPSDGDRRRRYVRLVHGALGDLVPGRRPVPEGPTLFVCTRNSARSPLAAALWRAGTGRPAQSAGTEPAAALDPGALDAARRHGLDLGAPRPRRLDEVDDAPTLVVTVCDVAHEDLPLATEHWHWSIPDPVPVGTPEAYDAVIGALEGRIGALGALGALGAPGALGADAAGPVVLLLCVHNAGRSQMAAGWLRHLSRGRVQVRSGGSEPASAVNPAAVAAMAEVGVDIADMVPRRWTEEDVGEADVVVTMGCGDTCPVLPGKSYEDWDLDDPAGQGVEAVRPIRDEIERRVRQLLVELGVPPSA